MSLPLIFVCLTRHAGSTLADLARDVAAAARPGALVAGEYLARTLPEHAPATPLALAACLHEGTVHRRGNIGQSV